MAVARGHTLGWPQDPCLLVFTPPRVSETCGVLLRAHGHGDEGHSLVTLGHPRLSRLILGTPCWPDDVCGHCEELGRTRRSAPTRK